jgi:UDP-N-acetylglucosamine acyltransferase
VIGARVSIGDGSSVGAGAQVQGPTRIGRDNRIFPMAAIGFEPQDLKFGGEEVFLEIGDRNQFREFTTMHRGTGKGGGVTRIGDDNYFLAYAHVAHDCQVGSRTLFVNGATLAGHVSVEDDATIGAYSSVHQFCRVGRHAYIGGYTVLTLDALPFCKTVGHKPLCYGLNTIGLKRKGFDDEAVKRLGKALRLLLRSKLPLAEALARMRSELAGEEAVEYLARFVESTERGVVKALPGRRGGRGGDEAGAAEEGERG